jgi:hypothetical protein
MEVAPHYHEKYDIEDLINSKKMPKKVGKSAEES